MTAVFQTVLNMSITGAYIAAAIILLRLVMKKFPKRFSYALWIILGIRLLCPFSFSSAASLFNLVKPETAENSVTSQMTYIPQSIEYDAPPQVTITPPLWDNSVNDALTESLPPPTPENSVNPMQIVLFIAAVVWLAGVTVMAVYTILSYFSVRKKLSGAALLRDNIYICGNIGTPFVYGTVRPKIYLPEDIPETDMDYILAHEQTHIRRGDHIVKLIAMAALCLHWFNPLVWISYKLMTKDMELSCDERAVSRFDRDVRKDYANALLNISARQNHISLGGILAFGESNIKSRIKGVLAAKKPTVIVTAAAIAAVAAAAVCLLTNAKNSAEDTPREMRTHQIVFPFHEMDKTVYNAGIFEGTPFAVNFSLPKDWRYAVPEEGGEVYCADLWSPVNILDENANVMGTIAFNRFELYGDTAEENYYRMVYNQIMLGSISNWDNGYTPVSQNDNGENAVTSVMVRDPDTNEETYYPAALGYNTNISAYVGIQFKEDAVTDEELRLIAESIYLNGETVYTDEMAMFRNYLVTYYTYAYMRTSENMLPMSAYTDSSDLISYMDLRLKFDTTLYGSGYLYLKDIVIKDGEIQRGEMTNGRAWISVPYEITYNLHEPNSERILRENAYFEYYTNAGGAIRISSCWLGSSGDRFVLPEPDGQPPYEFDFKAGTEKLTEWFFGDYLHGYYNAVFNGGVNYESFDIGKYTDSDDLKTYLQLKMTYDLDAYERYDLLSIEVGDSHIRSTVSFGDGELYHTDSNIGRSGVKNDGTKWMTIPLSLKYRDTLDGGESGWGGNAYFEYTDTDGYIRITAVQDGSAGSMYALDTLGYGEPPYSIYLKDGTEKLWDSPAVRKFTSSAWYDITNAGAEPTYLTEVCERYIYDYWNHVFKFGDFEPSDYISDPDMLNYANYMKYINNGYVSHSLRELNGIILRVEDFGEISDTRTWVTFEYDLGLVIDDVSQIIPDAFKGYKAYFELDKTDGGYRIYRAITHFAFYDLGLPDEPLPLPLPELDLNAAVRKGLDMSGFAITEPVLHYDGTGLSRTDSDDGSVTVSFSMPERWSADSGIVYPLKDYSSGNIKIMEFSPVYPASEAIPREDFLTDYAYGNEITLLDEEHYEGENLLYTDFYHIKKYSPEMQMELEQYIYTADRGGYSINVYAYPDGLHMDRWVCEEILKTLTIEKAEENNAVTVNTAVNFSQTADMLRERLQTLETSLEAESMSSFITYGVIDLDRDGSDELFAVLSNGSQGYCEVRFYRQDLTPLLLTDGFSRDGSTYFMYDEAESCLLMFSDYTHSYFLKNEKICALYGDGSMAELFEAVWTADSPRDKLKLTETYVNSEKVSETDYNSAYNVYADGDLSDIYFIYDGTLFRGSETVKSGGDVFYNYCQIRNTG